MQRTGVIPNPVAPRSDLGSLSEEADEAQPRHIALQLGRDIWRQRHTLRGM
jgi:hypothetical protein